MMCSDSASFISPFLWKERETDRGDHVRITLHLLLNLAMVSSSSSCPPSHGFLSQPHESKPMFAKHFPLFTSHQSDPPVLVQANCCRLHFPWIMSKRKGFVQRNVKAPGTFFRFLWSAPALWSLISRSVIWSIIWFVCRQKHSSRLGLICQVRVPCSTGHHFVANIQFMCVWSLFFLSVWSWVDQWVLSFWKIKQKFCWDSFSSANCYDMISFLPAYERFS